MSSTNQSPFYKKAEQAYLNATTDEERLYYLEEMIREAPKHKSSEKMLANLKSRLRKLKEKINRTRKSSGGRGIFIRKADMQCVLVGFPNTGKSSIFNTLTNRDSKISEIPYTTKEPIPGMMRYEDLQIQIIDEPSFPKQDKNSVNTADVILIVVNEIQDIKACEEHLSKSIGKRFILFAKADSLSNEKRRKIEATLRSKFKYPFFIFSIKDGEDKTNELRKAIFEQFDIVRIYTKEPRKEASKEPMVLKKGSKIIDVAEKIRKGFKESVKQIRIWGPSAKFGGQTVGFNHELKDRDVVEFKTK